MNRMTFVVAVVGLWLTGLSAEAEQAPSLDALARMPIKEVTVFKDGHAFVLHQGRMPTDAAGNVLMDYLPTPVLGTFWPYSADERGKLSAVVAGKRRVPVERTALNLKELLAANIGARVIITETTSKTYSATIAGIPTRQSAELEKAAPPNSGPKLPQKGELILLKTDDGVKAVKIDRIQDVVFKDEHKSTFRSEEFRNLLTLKLDWGGDPAPDAEVGMMYLQKGIRWIPHYKIVIDGKGKARVKLQATLINELADLEDVTMHLVVGVPSFRFAETVDPISLQRQAAQLSGYFRGSSQTAFALSNAIMTQMRASSRESARRAPGGPALGPALAGAARSEDLFIFDVEHVTLRKNQRMVVPIVEFTIPYRDVFTLDIPYTPPGEVWGDIRRRHWERNRNSGQTEVARLFYAPKVIHKIRLSNNSKCPITTAPVLILSEGRVLAQAMTQYTSVGSQLDLAVTTAVDISVEKDEKETERTPNALRWSGHDYARIDLSGYIKLTNHTDRPAELEITRYVLGTIGEVGQDGKGEKVNVLEDPGFVPAGTPGRTSWWGWYKWPDWWHRVNGIGRITWKQKLDPTKSIVLNYDWYYHWW